MPLKKDTQQEKDVVITSLNDVSVRWSILQQLNDVIFRRPTDVILYLTLYYDVNDVT